MAKPNTFTEVIQVGIDISYVSPTPWDSPCIPVIIEQETLPKVAPILRRLKKPFA